MNKFSKILKTSIVSLFLLILIIIVTIHYLSGPSYGQINTSAPITSPNSQPTFNMSPIAVSDSYISYYYPQAFVADTQNVNKGSTLTSYLYKYNLAPLTWKLGVEVDKLNQPNLSYDSNYQIRANNPGQYQLSTLDIGSYKFYIFMDKSSGNYAKSAYILNGNEAANISLTGASNNPNLDKSFNRVINSFKWK